jgi:hypothetical protein
MAQAAEDEDVIYGEDARAWMSISNKDERKGIRDRHRSRTSSERSTYE